MSTPDHRPLGGAPPEGGGPSRRSSSSRRGDRRRSPFATIAPALRRERWVLLAAGLAAIGSQLIGVPLALMVRRIVAVAEASIERDGVRWLVLVSAGLAMVVLVRSGLRWFQSALGEAAAARVVADARRRMHAALHQAGLGYLDRRPAGRILVRFVGDAGALRGWITNVLVRLPADILTVLAIAVALPMLHPWLLLAAVVPLLLLIPPMLLLHPRIRRRTRQGRRHQTRLSGLLADRLAVLAVLRATRRTAADRSEATRLIDAVAMATRARGRLDATVHALAIGGGTAALCAVAVTGIVLQEDGRIAPGDLLAAIWLTFLVRGPVMRLARAGSVHQRAKVSVERIAALADRPPEPGHAPHLEPFVARGEVLHLSGIGYRGHDGRWLIRNLDVRMCGPGLHVVHGPVRARTILLDLLLRLRRPHHGRIRLDGRDLRRVPVDDLRRSVALIDRERRVLDVVATTGRHAWWQGRPLGVAAAWRAAMALEPGSPVPDRPDPDWRERPPARQLQLAAWAVLADDPAIVLVDDPLRDTSPAEAARVIRWLQQLAERRLVIAASDDDRLRTLASPIDLSTPMSPPAAPPPETQPRIQSEVPDPLADRPTASSFP